MQAPTLHSPSLDSFTTQVSSRSGTPSSTSRPSATYLSIVPSSLSLMPQAQHQQHHHVPSHDHAEFQNAVESLRQNSVWVPRPPPIQLPTPAQSPQQNKLRSMGVHDFEKQHRPGGLDVTDFELELQHQGFFKASTFLPANPTPMQLQANAKWWQRMLERVCKSEPKVPSWFLEQCREQVKRAGGQSEARNDRMWLQWLQIFETRESHRQKQLLQYYNQRMAFYLKNMWPTVDSSKLTKQLQLLPPNQHLEYYKKCVEFYQRNIDLVVGSSGPSERSPLVTLPSPDQQYLMDIKYQHQSTNGTVSTFEEDDSTETLAVLPPDEAESGNNDSTNGSDRAWHEVLRLYSA